MGAYSTMEITRQDAISVILQNLHTASDEEISDMLFELVGRKNLHNFKIVADYNGPWFIKYNGDF